jgi:hypothetical protein
MNSIIYKDIAKLTNKSESAIKQWKKNNPDLLELCKLGAFCKKNNLDIEQIKKLVELKELVKKE